MDEQEQLAFFKNMTAYLLHELGGTCVVHAQGIVSRDVVMHKDSNDQWVLEFADKAGSVGPTVQV